MHLVLFFLAAEIYKNRQQSLMFQKPILVVFVFGLLHGFGFADVLLNLGLPRGEIAIGLLSFNFGIELGQIMFICLCLTLAGISKYIIRISYIRNNIIFSSQKLIVFAIGVIAGFWTIERFVNSILVYDTFLAF